jgi:CRISPR-associated protein Csx10
MKSFKITLTQKSPVCFSNSRHKQNIFYTHDYIPGSVLWGFFINRYVKAGKDIHPDFFNDNIRFLNCYINIREGKNSCQALPVPLSLSTCKTIPYLIEQNQNKGHALVDLLFKDDTECRREKCASQLRPVPAGYLYSFDKNNIYHPRKIVEMHNKIKKETQNTDKDSLYSYELLDEVGKEFVGQILVKENSPLIEFIKNFNGQNLGLGKARTSGYGYFTLNIAEKTDPGLDKYFAAEFQDEINIYLHSDVILMDGLNCCQTVISPEILGLPDEIILEKSFARSMEIQGFNAKHQKTRINDIAVWKGTCFSYRVKAGVDRSLIEKRLREIESDGLGIRKNEGFGRVKFNRVEFKED